MALARSENSPQRFYSMSAQIRQERNAYYDILEATQKGDLDITPWLEWFLGCLDRAFDGAEEDSCDRAQEGRFWEKHAALRVQRPPARHAQPAARRVRRQAHLIEVGDDREVLAGHGAARHHRSALSAASWQKDEGGGRSTSYSLVIDGRPG